MRSMADLDRSMSNVVIYWVYDAEADEIAGEPWDNPDGPLRWMDDNGVIGAVLAATYGAPTDVEPVA